MLDLFLWGERAGGQESKMMFVVVVAVGAGCCLGGGGVCVWGSVCGRAEGSNGIDVRSVGGMRLLPGGLLHWRC